MAAGALARAASPSLGRRCGCLLGSELRSTPGTPEKNIGILGIWVPLKRLQLLDRIVPRVRRGRAAHPETDPERPITQGADFTAAQLLHSAEKGRRPLELLGSEQPQRVPHEDIDPAVGNPGQRIEEHGERGQSEVCLGLAATGREPDEIDYLSVSMARIADAPQRHQ